MTSTLMQPSYGIQCGCAFYWFGIKAIKFLLLPEIFFLHHHFLICELKLSNDSGAKAIHHWLLDAQLYRFVWKIFFFSLHLKKNKKIPLVSFMCESVCDRLSCGIANECKNSTIDMVVGGEVNDEIVKNIVSDINASCGIFVETWEYIELTRKAIWRVLYLRTLIYGWKSWEIKVEDFRAPLFIFMVLKENKFLVGKKFDLNFY